MAKNPYMPGPDPADLDNTQPTSNPTERLPPVPPPGKGHVRARDRRAARAERSKADELFVSPAEREIMAAAERRARRRTTRRDSGLFLPAWSVILMLVVVFGIAALIVMAVLLVGGNEAADGAPRVVIITAVPSDTPVVTPAPLPLGTQPASGEQVPSFALEGPVLPTVGISPTPSRIGVGSTVRVINVGASKLNVRAGPGTSNRVLFQATVGDTFLVIDGPQTSENFTWWNIRSSSDTSRVGWAVENDGAQDVLEVVP